MSERPAGYIVHCTSCDWRGNVMVVTRCPRCHSLSVYKTGTVEGVIALPEDGTAIPPGLVTDHPAQHVTCQGCGWSDILALCAVVKLDDPPGVGYHCPKCHNGIMRVQTFYPDPETAPAWVNKGFSAPEPEPDLLTKQPTVGDYTEYDHYLKLMGEAQRYKLRLKAHRGWIGNVPTNRLFALLRKEVDELEEAMQRNNHFDMILESADIANYALGILIAVIEGKKENGI